MLFYLISLLLLARNHDTELFKVLYSDASLTNHEYTHLLNELSYTANTELLDVVCNSSVTVIEYSLASARFGANYTKVLHFYIQKYGIEEPSFGKLFLVATASLFDPNTYPIAIYPQAVSVDVTFAGKKLTIPSLK